MKLSIVNFCSVTNKRTQLEVFLVTYAIDIIIGTESHLNESILNSEVFPNNYQTYRKDRKTSGGGVFISIKSSIPCTQINDNSTIEIVWAHVHLDKNNDFIVGSFYCPPHSSDTILDNLQSSIDTIKQKYPHTQIILGGDFNCPGIDWENSTLINSYVSCPLLEGS